MWLCAFFVFGGKKKVARDRTMTNQTPARHGVEDWRWFWVACAELDVTAKEVFEVAEISRWSGYKVIGNFQPAPSGFEDRLQRALNSLRKQDAAIAA